jgi:hypothetical protein
MAEAPAMSVCPTDGSQRPWNKGLLIGQKKPLAPKHVWSIRVRLEIAGSSRDLAIFNLAIDGKLRASLRLGPPPKNSLNGFVKARETRPASSSLVSAMSASIPERAVSGAPTIERASIPVACAFSPGDQ